MAPEGVREERRHKFINQIMDANGTRHAREQAGPASIEAWRSCWAVFSTAAVMLEIAPPATLARNGMKFEERALRYASAWHLAVTAENRCRSEFLGAERRQERFYQEQLGMTAFNPVGDGVA